MENAETPRDDRSLDERLEALKQQSRPDRKTKVVRRRASVAQHEPTRLAGAFDQRAQDATDAAAATLRSAQTRISRRNEEAGATHRDAKRALEKQSTAAADENEPAAMVARRRLDQIRAELKRQK
ncbi:hypothetical protein BKA01_003334 [Pseudonocardia eucalypti]|nr:hypothetical protein [Pseudonocardia eucalypti]